MRFPQTDFNCAVMQMAMHVCPTGWDIVPESEAPSTLDELYEAVAKSGRIPISDAHSDHTIFADPEYNYAFRAWHDWTHWKYKTPFTLAGEKDTASHQIVDIGKIFGYGDIWKRYARLIVAEVTGQAEYFEKWGTFPADQERFAEAYLTVGHQWAVSLHPDLYRIN